MGMAVAGKVVTVRGMSVARGVVKRHPDNRKRTQAINISGILPGFILASLSCLFQNAQVAIVKLMILSVKKVDIGRTVCGVGGAGGGTDGDPQHAQVFLRIHHLRGFLAALFAAQVGIQGSDRPAVGLQCGAVPIHHAGLLGTRFNTDLDIGWRVGITLCPASGKTRVVDGHIPGQLAGQAARHPHFYLAIGVLDNGTQVRILGGRVGDRKRRGGLPGCARTGCQQYHQQNHTKPGENSQFLHGMLLWVRMKKDSVLIQFFPTLNAT